MRLHRWLDFKVTRRCNNHSRKCDYCEVPVDPEGAREVLSLGEIHRVLMDAYGLGFDHIWLLGGEPTLRADAHHLFDPLADETDAVLTMVTNGKTRRDDAYRALYATRARRACVQVSLDSMRPDNLKHSDSSVVLDLVRDLKRMADRTSRCSHDCSVEVHCVISRQNRRDFDHFATSLAGEGVGVSLAMVCPWRVTGSPGHFNEFTRPEMQSIARRIEGLRTGLAVDEFNPVVARFIRRVLGDDCSGRQRPCGGGLTHIVVNGDGSVYRCMSQSFCTGMELGSIRTGRLHEALRHADAPSSCPEKSDCFDGFAWDMLALEAEEVA